MGLSQIRHMDKIYELERDLIGLSYGEFKLNLLSRLRDLCANGLDDSHFREEPGLIVFRQVYCVVFLDRKTNRLRIGFGKEGDLSSPLDFALLPQLSESGMRWRRPYENEESFSSGQLAEICVRTMTQKF